MSSSQPAVIRKQLPPRKTQTFRLDLAYRGSFFCGWQSQGQGGQQLQGRKSTPTNADVKLLMGDQETKMDGNIISPNLSSRISSPLPAVQDVIERALDGRNVRVAGRTDAGVHAFGQVARVRTDRDMTASRLWEQLLEASSMEEMKKKTKEATTPHWKCWRVTAESSQFHPTFDAKNRSYVYILDGWSLSEYLLDTKLNKKKKNKNSHSSQTEAMGLGARQQPAYRRANPTTVSSNDEAVEQDPSSFSTTTTTLLENRLHQICCQLNRLFRPLVGQSLDYVALSHGKVKTQDTFVCFSHLQARLGQVVVAGAPEQEEEATLPVLDENILPNSSSHVVLIVELTANRFLRRMIRILVATALMQLVQASSSSSFNPDGRLLENQLGCGEWMDDDDSIPTAVLGTAYYCDEKHSPSLVVEEMRTISTLSSSSIPSGDKNNKSEEEERHDVDNALYHIVLTRNRTLAAHAAPPDGLIFVGAEF